MLIVPVSQFEFDIYKLSLPISVDHPSLMFQSAWKLADGRSIAAVFFNQNTACFDVLVCRRRVDNRLVLSCDMQGFKSQEAATEKLIDELKLDNEVPKLHPGEKTRKPLLQLANKKVGSHFRLLTNSISHFPALMAVGEVYLAMPNPDDNFVPDFQTANFDSRLFEVYLFAAFREQGVAVSQDHASPDFRLEREGQRCFVEAVTANPKDGRAQGFATPTFAPEEREERLIGPAAVRFAKTLRSKLQRGYEDLPHVQGNPFAIAIADFHAPSSMVWTREALPSYLYGMQATVVDGPDGPKAIDSSVKHLLGEDHVPAGLFRDPGMAHLSAVIFSNAATLGKFNRMGFLAGWRPAGLSIVREGILFDRTLGALKPIPFSMDILSKEYSDLCDGGEAWCQELEVFHNPLATNPLPFELLPGATHWFEEDKEVRCTSVWKNAILASVTQLRMFNANKEEDARRR